MNDKKFIPFWMEKPKEEIINAYIECIHNGEVLLARINDAIEFIDHELNGHILLGDEETWNIEYYTNDKLDYKKLCIAFLQDLLDILRGEDK